jgi:hypothetical protein
MQLMDEPQVSEGFVERNGEKLPQIVVTAEWLLNWGELFALSRKFTEVSEDNKTLKTSLEVLKEKDGWKVNDAYPREISDALGVSDRLMIYAREYLGRREKEKAKKQEQTEAPCAAETTFVTKDQLESLESRMTQHLEKISYLLESKQEEDFKKPRPAPPVQIAVRKAEPVKTQTKPELPALNPEEIVDEGFRNQLKEAEKALERVTNTEEMKDLVHELAQRKTDPTERPTSEFGLDILGEQKMTALFRKVLERLDGFEKDAKIGQLHIALDEVLDKEGMFDTYESDQLGKLKKSIVEQLFNAYYIRKTKTGIMVDKSEIRSQLKIVKEEEEKMNQALNLGDKEKEFHAVTKKHRESQPEKRKENVEKIIKKARDYKEKKVKLEQEPEKEEEEAEEEEEEIDAPNGDSVEGFAGDK